MWLKGLKEKTADGTRRVEPILFQLPEVLQAVRDGRPVCVAEGEKDVRTLASWGLVATCNPEGAGKWKKAFAQHLKGATVVHVFPDNDDLGRKHAQDVARSLHGLVGEVRVVELPDLPPKGDVTDWAASGRTFEDLGRAVASAAPWKPGGDEAAAAYAEGLANMTDVGNAVRLVKRHGNDIRHCLPWKAWLAWDGRRWRKDETGEIYRRAVDTVKAIPKEAEEVEGADVGELVKWALKSEDSGKVEAMVRRASFMDGVPIVPDELDVDDWTMNVQNGTLDLRTGLLRPHRREDLLTKIAPVAYVPEAKCPIFERFLLESMGGDEELVAYLQRAAGYSLTGDISEHAMFILYGVGRNGKSTFLESVSSAIGDYGTTTEFSTWFERKSENVRHDLADLKGARYVTAIESQQGKKLDEAIIKSITGGDTVKARHLYANYFTFRPQLKLWLATNHKPVISGTDKGIWARIRLVPFEVTIPEAKRDKSLRVKLLAELPGILAWLVRGCLEWQRIGLAEPASIREATADYQEEMDTLADFFRECCGFHPGFRCLASDLYAAYRNFCKEDGQRDEDIMKSRSFGMRLTDRGLKRERARDRSNKHQWLGIAIVDDMTSTDMQIFQAQERLRFAMEQAAAEQPVHAGGGNGNGHAGGNGNGKPAGEKPARKEIHFLCGLVHEGWS